VSDDLSRQVQVLRAEVRRMQIVLERKNQMLDALHYVWCDGGCPSGVHRWDDALITEDLVRSAERNARRLRRWYEIVRWRSRLPGADSWQKKRWARATAKTDLGNSPIADAAANID
jgi:hypothetical protein